MAAEGDKEAGEPKKSDLLTRSLSAVVMVAVSGGALWLGGWPWAVFVLLVTVGVLWEWSKLSRAIAQSWWGRALWLVAGVVYVGVASQLLIEMRMTELSIWLPSLILAVIATDSGAYFSGRVIGGPKIAPKISPSKTWAGLAGGVLAAVLVLVVAFYIPYRQELVWWKNAPAHLQPAFDWKPAVTLGTLIAIIAQTGDFFESWMKRRAGVKDSSHLIPGHGGLFDRLDGLLAVLFVAGVIGALGNL